MQADEQELDQYVPFAVFVLMFTGMALVAGGSYYLNAAEAGQPIFTIGAIASVAVGAILLLLGLKVSRRA